MLARIIEIAGVYGITPQMMLLAALGLGVLITVYGLAGTFAGPGDDVRRMRGPTMSYAGTSQGADLIRSYERRPSGFLKAFVPATESERNKVAKALRRAGYHGRHAVREYYTLRTLLAAALPLAFLALLIAEERFGIGIELGRLSGIALFQIVASLVLAGFYGPALYLRHKISQRRNAIRLGLPNALDLLQVAIEAGLGFDAAMTRVANELARVTPAISEEFLMLQLEIQAGKDRDRAFLDMAERTGVDEVSSFSNVILQATQFGTSVSDALATYAADMRLDRELRAQEKANKLPVKMSGVMAAMMMPTLLMLILSPVLIRWIRVMNVE
jgi:tight adherence protein C